MEGHLWAVPYLHMIKVRATSNPCHKQVTLQPERLKLQRASPSLLKKIKNYKAVLSIVSLLHTQAQYRPLDFFWYY